MVAVLPEPPLLVPELATARPPRRPSCGRPAVAAATRLAAAAPRWVAVGADPGGRRTVGRRRPAAASSGSASTSSSGWTPPGTPAGARSTRGCRCRCWSPAGWRRGPARAVADPRRAGRPRRAARRLRARSAPSWPRSAPPTRTGRAARASATAPPPTPRRPPATSTSAPARSTPRSPTALRDADPAALAALDPGSPRSCWPPGGRRGRCWPGRRPGRAVARGAAALLDAVRRRLPRGRLDPRR